MISFDLINSIFKCWFRFELCYFNFSVYTKLFKIIVKQSYSWYIHGSGGNTFQMIMFDLINSLFKCWYRLKCCYFNSTVHTKWIKILAKGCSHFIIGELWWKLDWYFIDHFRRFWEARCFWVESNQLFFNLFSFLMLLLYEIYQFLFWLFEFFIGWRHLGFRFFSKWYSEYGCSEVILST